MAKKLKPKDFSWNEEKRFRLRDLARPISELEDIEEKEIIIAETLLYKGEKIDSSMVRFLPDEVMQMVEDEINSNKETISINIIQKSKDNIAQKEAEKAAKNQEREDKLKEEKENKQTVFFPDFSKNQGYQLSGNALFTDLKSKFLEGRTLHLRAWSENLEYSENTQATYRVKVGYRKVDGLLNICGDDRSYKDSLLLNNFPLGKGFVEMELKDSNKKKYKVKMDFEII